MQRWAMTTMLSRLVRITMTSCMHDADGDDDDSDADYDEDCGDGHNEGRRMLYEDDVYYEGADANDYDGDTDDDMLVGSECDGPDSDQCAYGTWVCAADGKGVICPDEVVSDVQEACNGFDDDCDGIVDEVDVDPIEAGCNIQGVVNLTAAIVIYCGAQ